jgi:hypothetical protein
MIRIRQKISHLATVSAKSGMAGTGLRGRAVPVQTVADPAKISYLATISAKSGMAGTGLRGRAVPVQTVAGTVGNANLLNFLKWSITLG